MTIYRRQIDGLESIFSQQANDNTNSMKQNGKIGTVVAVRGSVVDVHFDEGLPHFDTLLRTGSHGEIAIEVLYIP